MVLQRKYEILLVEDDEIDVLNIKRSFTKFRIPHKLNIASNGEEALDLMMGRNGKNKISKPNFILLDINMPKMNGLEFLAQMRSMPDLHEIPVYILSTSSEADDKNKAFQYNVAGYILKPISTEKFEEAIINLNNFWEINEFP